MPTAPTPKNRPWSKQAKQDPESKYIYDTVYNTRRWKRLRRMILSRHPVCTECLKEGRTAPATVADHIIPIKQGGAIWDIDNLTGLCERCHNKKRQTERK